MSDYGDNTRAVHGGDEPDPSTGALDPPIVLANTFAFESAEDAAAQFAGEREGWIYSRWRNPTVRSFERKMAALEEAEDAVALSSGMGAVYGAVTTLVEQGEHVIAPAGLYAETAKLLRQRMIRFGVETTFVDMTDVDGVRSAMRPETRVVWVETPANPTLAIYDIEAIAALAHERGARVVCDNTFATPYHQRPLSQGADLVVHAATKAIGGHGDAVGGVVAGPTSLCERVREEVVRAAGNVMSPFTAWVIARGARTLPLRADRASQTAGTLAEALREHPAVERVCYPGLADHPGHEVAARQMRNGFGALVAFEVRGGVDAGRRAHDRLRLVTRAVSLGDVKTLVSHPATTTHASMPADARRGAGIADGLMRLSIGIEDVDDLWSDLEQALA